MESYDPQKRIHQNEDMIYTSPLTLLYCHISCQQKPLFAFFSGSFAETTRFSLLFAYCFLLCREQASILFAVALIVSSLRKVDDIFLVGVLLTLFSKEALEAIHVLK